MKRNSGQITVEAVLVLVILFSTAYAATKVLSDGAYLSRLVEKPWQHLAGMMQNGVWAPPEKGMDLHPNHLSRHGSPRGDTP